jgi:hypothetical protein
VPCRYRRYILDCLLHPRRIARRAAAFAKRPFRESEGAARGRGSRPLEKRGCYETPLDCCSGEGFDDDSKFEWGLASVAFKQRTAQIVASAVLKAAPPIRFSMRLRL